MRLTEYPSQTLNVNVEIPIPNDSVIVKKVEIEDLRKQTLTGVYWTMKDLETRINKKQQWIKDNILYVPKFKEILDSENGGFVFYPKMQGQTWSFQASKMAKFLEENFYQIFSNL
ncbi:DUF771 domain-containing protein [Caldibacillus lycopersici]|uniref:DUF771 domain-containing protein n=1 Tax=Perspicuibacillus lycopersici TaxID=1325689 RepID=A0AAE3LMA8_9BACI|nr:DUF771 domain-containing protein [Perspicuibacillus lycopersici]MCU9612746.1 DUF771 domain-containing protein [Perspicuibacillus lycopersici]